MAMLVPSFLVVVIGGMGSLPGAVLAGLLMGEAVSLAVLVYPPIAQVIVYIVAAVILLVAPARPARRPRGDGMTRPLRADSPWREGALMVVVAAVLLGAALDPGRDRRLSRARVPDHHLGHLRARLRPPGRLHRLSVVRPRGVLGPRRLRRRLLAPALHRQRAGRDGRRHRSRPRWSRSCSGYLTLRRHGIYFADPDARLRRDVLLRGAGAAAGLDRRRQRPDRDPDARARRACRSRVRRSTTWSAPCALIARLRRHGGSRARPSG